MLYLWKARMGYLKPLREDPSSFVTVGSAGRILYSLDVGIFRLPLQRLPLGVELMVRLLDLI